MPTRAKIKINDVPELRTILDTIYDSKTQIQLARWALGLAEHILALVEYDYKNDLAIQNGFTVNKMWQANAARMFDVRQAGFKVHQQAKACDDQVVQAALRVAGQAVGTGHMREHAMVASDYAIKTINLKYPGDMDAVISEREWQINSLR